MTTQVRIADLPTVDKIDAGSYIIVERPGYQEGTFKSTVETLQEATSVTAEVTQENNVTTISVDDIRGHSEASIVTPTAKIVDNKDGTVTIIISDTTGTYRETLIKDTLNLDDEPEYGSENFLTSGAIYNYTQKILDRIALIESRTLVLYCSPTLTEDGEEIVTEEGQVILATIEGTIAEMREYDGSPYTVFNANGFVYSNLVVAISKAVETGCDVRLLGNTTISALNVPANSNFALELNGYTLDIAGPGVGSHQAGMRIGDGCNIEIRNGHLRFDDPDILVGLENYGSLSLNNVQVSGSLMMNYAIQNYSGNNIYSNGTLIVGNRLDNQFALNVVYGTQEQYQEECFVTLKDESVRIIGTIEFAKGDRVSPELFAEHAGITCPAFMNVPVEARYYPCEWVDNGDGTKTFKCIPDPDAIS